MSPLSPLSILMLKLFTSLGSDECSAALLKKSSSSIGGITSPQSGKVCCLIWSSAPVKINRTVPIFVLCLWDCLDGWWASDASSFCFQGRPTFRRLKPYRPHPSSPVVFIYHTCRPLTPHVYNEIKRVTFCNTFRGLYCRSFSLTSQL